MKLVVGLGNPGKEYANTRHNIGFQLLDKIASDKGLDFFREKFNGKYIEYNVNGEKVAQIFKFLVYMMNIFGRKGLYHSDITPKNIIVDNKGHFLGFVDVDSVNICSKNFAFATMAAKYKEMGFNPSELLADYRTLTHDTIDANYVNKYINLVATGKHILWKLRRRDNGK